MRGFGLGGEDLSHAKPRFVGPMDASDDVLTKSRVAKVLLARKSGTSPEAFGLSQESSLLVSDKHDAFDDGEPATQVVEDETRLEEDHHSEGSTYLGLTNSGNGVRLRSTKIEDARHSSSKSGTRLVDAASKMKKPRPHVVERLRRAEQANITSIAPTMKVYFSDSEDEDDDFTHFRRSPHGVTRVPSSSEFLRTESEEFVYHTRKRAGSRGTFLDRRDIVDEAAEFILRENRSRAMHDSSFRSGESNSRGSDAVNAIYKVLSEQEQRHKIVATQHQQPEQHLPQQQKDISQLQQIQQRYAFAPQVSQAQQQRNQRTDRQGMHNLKRQGIPLASPTLLESVAASQEHLNRSFRGFCVDDNADTQRLTFTPFCQACVEGKSDLVSSILDASAMFPDRLIDAKNHLGRTALHCVTALHRGSFHAAHESVLRILLQAGANTDDRDKTGWTPLFYAVQNEHRAAIRLLCEYGANLYLRDHPTWVIDAMSSQAAITLLEEVAADDCDMTDLESSRNLFTLCRDLGHTALLEYLVTYTTIRIESPTRLSWGFQALMPEVDDIEENVVLIRWSAMTETQDFDVYLHVVDTIASAAQNKLSIPPSFSIDRVESESLQSLLQHATCTIQQRIRSLHRFQLQHGDQNDVKRDLLSALLGIADEGGPLHQQETRSRRNSVHSQGQGMNSSTTTAGPMISKPPKRMTLEHIGRAMSNRTNASERAAAMNVPSLLSLHLAHIENASQFCWTLSSEVRELIPPDALCLFEVTHARNEGICGYSSVFPVFQSAVNNCEEIN